MDDIVSTSDCWRATRHDGSGLVWYGGSMTSHRTNETCKGFWLPKAIDNNINSRTHAWEPRIPATWTGEVDVVPLVEWLDTAVPPIDGEPAQFWAVYLKTEQGSILFDDYDLESSAEQAARGLRKIASARSGRRTG